MPDLLAERCLVVAGVDRAYTLFVTVKVELYGPCWAIAVFFDEHIHDIFALRLWVVVIFAVQECHDVGILLDRA